MLFLPQFFVRSTSSAPSSASSRSLWGSGRLFWSIVLGLGLTGGNSALVAPVFAQAPSLSTTPSTAPITPVVVIPDTLRSALQSLDQAAGQENLDLVLQHYSTTFQDGDGLTRSDLGSVLEKFWQRYDQLSYQTQVISATSTPEGWTLDTVITIEGTELNQSRSLRLKSEIHAIQTWNNNQLVRQDIVTERNVVTTGQEPPTLTMNLPAEVQVNERFNLDVILNEPLEEDLVVGAIVDEPITIDGFLSPERPEFEPLLSGGMFKVGRAPAQPDNRWISAVVIRKGGMTSVTQRLRIIK